MKKPTGLNHWYYVGQVFTLDQKTFNEVIDDVRYLLDVLHGLGVDLADHSNQREDGVGKDHSRKKASE